MLPDQMKTIELPEFGGPDVMVLGSRDLPVPRDGDVLIKVAAAGVNGPDIIQRRGHYPPPPGASDLMGLEVAGVVVAIGKDVKSWSIGDEICGLTNGGGYAEYVAVEASHCLPIPGGVDLIDAAGLPETYFTVWSNLFLDAIPDKGTKILIHGGAGGIGSTAIGLSKALGLEVFATAGNAENIAFCQSLGADHAINYKEQDFVEVVKAAKGANLILDIIGGDYIARNIKAAAPDAKIVQLAFNQGSKVEINLMPVMLKRLIFTGSTLRSRPTAFKTRTAASINEHVWPMFEAGSLKALTHKVLPFDQVVKAHEMMEASAHRGKILITP